MKRLVVALAVALSSVAGAQDPPKGFWSSGTGRATDANPPRPFTVFGTYNCAQWVSGAGGASARNWLAGFLSGLNGDQRRKWNNTSPDPLDEITFDQAALWMDKWCRENPLERLSTGALALYDELDTRASKNKR